MTPAKSHSSLAEAIQAIGECKIQSPDHCIEMQKPSFFLLGTSRSFKDFATLLGKIDNFFQFWHFSSVFFPLPILFDLVPKSV